MNMKTILRFTVCFVLALPALGQKLLIPMDLTQTDHLKACGVAYYALAHGLNVEWLLNYRGGSFMMDYAPKGQSFRYGGAGDQSQTIN